MYWILYSQPPNLSSLQWEKEREGKRKVAWIIAVLAFVAWLAGSVVSLARFPEGSITATLGQSALYALSAWPPLALWLTAILDVFLFNNRLRHSSVPAQVEEATSA